MKRSHDERKGEERDDEEAFDPDALSDEEFRKLDIEETMGESYENLSRMSAVKRRLFEFMYHPRTELFLFLLIVISVVLLVIEVSLPKRGPVGWLGGLSTGEVTGGFFWVDIVLTGIFVVEYVIKLWIAPRKWYFVRTNWVDLLAIIPILRIFRIGRAMRLLRLLKLLRLVRVGRIVSQQLTSLSGDVQRRLVENVIILVYMIFSLVFGTVGVLVFEKGHKSGFETLGDGLWWCVVTLTTVGYGDKFPVTTGGKIVAAIIMFIGLSFYALLTGVLSSILIERSRKAEQQGVDALALTDHVVICGWNDNGMSLMRDLRQVDSRSRIVVVSDNENTPQLLDANIFYITQDPTTADSLARARVHTARTVVVLADVSQGRSSQDADARSILTVLAIEKQNSKVHTLVELLNEENVFHVKNAGVDEVIVSGAYTGTMLSQSVQSPGVSDVYNSVLRTASSNHVRTVPMPEVLDGHTFEDVYLAIYAKQGGIILGYQRDGATEMSPLPGTVLKTGDELILIERVLDKKERKRRAKAERKAAKAKAKGDEDA